MVIGSHNYGGWEVPLSATWKQETHKSAVHFTLSPKPANQARDENPSPRAGGDKMFSSSNEAGKKEGPNFASFTFCSVQALSGLMMPTREGDQPYWAHRFANLTQKHPNRHTQKQCLIWVHFVPLKAALLFSHTGFCLGSKYTSSYQMLSHMPFLLNKCCSFPCFLS